MFSDPSTPIRSKLSPCRPAHPAAFPPQLATASPPGARHAPDLPLGEQRAGLGLDRVLTRPSPPYKLLVCLTLRAC